MTAAPLTPQDVFSTIPSDHRGTFVRLAEQRATAAAGGADPTPEQLCEAAKSIFADIPEAARERFAKIAEQRAQLAAAATVRATAANLPPSADQIIQEAEAALVREQREECDEVAWAEALAKHGKGRVARVETPDGCIIMRTVTLREQDMFVERLAGVSGSGRLTVAREYTLDTVEYPPREKVRAVTDKFPGIWEHLYAARNALADGEVARISGKA